MPSPEPAAFCYVRFTWRGHERNYEQPRLGPLRMYEVQYGPSDEFPFGRRGMVMLRAWRRLSDPAMLGMLVQDGDVLVDPSDAAAMLEAIHAEPKCVITAPAKLWRGKAEMPWTWAHWRGEASQEFEADPDFFCFNFTFLPRDLLEACAKRDMHKWAFPSVDTEMARVARDLGIPVRVCAALPKHMNW